MFCVCALCKQPGLRGQYSPYTYDAQHFWGCTFAVLSRSWCCAGLTIVLVSWARSGQLGRRGKGYQVWPLSLLMSAMSMFSMSFDMALRAHSPPGHSTSPSLGSTWYDAHVRGVCGKEDDEMRASCAVHPGTSLACAITVGPPVLRGLPEW